MRRENRRLREDVDVLKRATAFFVKETREGSQKVDGLAYVAVGRGDPDAEARGKASIGVAAAQVGQDEQGLPAAGHRRRQLRLPDDLDAKLTERARRERRSKQELAIEAIREAQNRAELKVDDVLTELMDSDAEILDHLK